MQSLTHSGPSKLLSAYLVSGLITAFILGAAAGYYLGIAKSSSMNNNAAKFSFTRSASSSPQYVLQKDVNPPARKIPLASESSNMKNFTSRMAGFSIDYPDTWSVIDNTMSNCGYKSQGVVEAIHDKWDYCRDSFDVISPDGIVVEYLLYGDDFDGRIKEECGSTSPCLPYYINDIETLHTHGFLGDILLVKMGRFVYLHKGVEGDSLPVIGQSKPVSATPIFSLPSKTGVRFALFLHTGGGYFVPSSFNQLTDEQFYNDDRVRQGIQILRSIRY